jgi:hypothetical protein
MSDCHDLLLEWASETGSGSWGAFRVAWEWIQSRDLDRRPGDPAGKAWIAGAGLASLGHLEMTWEGAGAWAATPPVITMLPNSGGRALLTGARTRALYRPGTDSREQAGAVAEAAQGLDVWIDDIPMKDGPTSVLIACEQAQDAERLAECCGIAFSYSVSDQLSAMLPPLSAYAALSHRGALPQGFPLERFDPAILMWSQYDKDEPDEPGLYRARSYSEHVHVLVTPLGAHLRVAREHAVFEVLRWGNLAVIEYDGGLHELWLPVQTRLPLLHERAAVLCSGRLPRFDRRRGEPGLLYVNVPPHVAERIARSLDQEISSLA